jgi:putative transposon-encoded protein
LIFPIDFRCFRAARKIECRAEQTRSIIMAIAAHSSTVKVVGANGQISLGKQYAGRQVLVEEREPGVWIVRTATVIPDNERWLHEPKAADDLQAAMAWSVTHAASDADADDTLKRLEHGEQ